MSKVWDGFYVGTNRLGRFISAIGLNRAFNISFTGIAPDNMRFQLQGTPTPTDGVLLTVDYKTPYTVVVAVNGTSVYPLAYGQVVTLGANSGTNQWLSKERKLQFVIRAFDMISVQRVDSIQLTMRLNMTTADFFASNGQTEFVDRLAAALNIPPYRIRVADIRAGSTIIEFALAGNENLASQYAKNTNYSNAMQEELISLNNLLLTLAQNGSLVLNAPLLSMTSSVNFTTPGNITSDTPVVITPETPSGSNDPVEAGDGSENKDVLEWWGILLIVTGVLVIVGVAIYLVYRKFFRKNVTVPQPTVIFERIKGDKDFDSMHDPATSQRSGRAAQ